MTNVHLSGLDSWVPAHDTSFGVTASKSMSGVRTRSLVSKVHAKHEKYRPGEIILMPLSGSVSQ